MGHGGEFTLQTSSDLSWVLDNYDSKTKNVQGSVDTFQTFCVEMHEYIYPNATYEVKIGDTSHFSGVGLTKGAAWLYYEFATGSLSGYDYSPNRSTAEALQEAIWWMMYQQGLPPNNVFATDVLDQFGTSSEAFKLNNGAYGVKVLNMWAPGGVADGEGRPGYERQDQLVLTSVPDGGTTAALLALGFGGLFLVSRKEFIAQCYSQPQARDTSFDERALLEGKGLALLAPLPRPARRSAHRAAKAST